MCNDTGQVPAGGPSRRWGGGSHDYDMTDDSATSHAELDDVCPALAMVLWGLNTATPPWPPGNGTSPHLAETASPTEEGVTVLEHKTLLGEHTTLLGQAGASGDNVIKTTGLLERPVLQGAQESRSKRAVQILSGAAYDTPT